MPIDNFNKKFDLKSFHFANKQIHFDKNEPLLKFFIKFINNDDLIKRAIEENDSNKTPPAQTFVKYYEKNLEKLWKDKSSDERRIVASKLKALMSYLFLELNKNYYSKGVQINIANKFLYKPVIFVLRKTPLSSVKEMHAKIENTIFETRSMIYTTSYKRMVKAIETISTPMARNKSIYGNLHTYFSNMLFKDDSIGSDKKVFCFEKDSKLSDAIKSEACLFLLDNNNVTVKKWFSKDEYIKALINLLEKYNNLMPNSKVSLDADKAVRNAFEIKQRFKKTKLDYCDYSLAEIKKKISSSKMEQLSKIVSMIDDVLDEMSSLTKNEKIKDTLSILAYINRFGIINLILIDTFNQKAKWSNNNYDPYRDNKLAKEASARSECVENRINKLAKIFNCIDLNKILSRKEKCIHGLPYNFDESRPDYKKIDTNSKCRKKEKYNHKLSSEIYKKTHIFKAVFSRITYKKNSILVDDKSSLFFFDVYSHFLAYSHSFDKMTLLEIVDDKKIRKKFKDALCRISDLRTYQLHFDDSQFTQSIMDQYSSFIQFKTVTNSNASFNDVQSHKYRLYSVWDFVTLCDAIIFGTSSNLLNEQLIKYTSENYTMNGRHKSGIFKQYRLLKIYSDINIKCNHVAYSSKARNHAFLDKCFEKMGLINIEDKLKHIFDAAWQHANIKTNRLYSKLGIYFTLSSFIISVIGFAWAGAIFIDFERTEIGGFTYLSLFYELLKTQKFHFVLIAALIPFVIYLLILIHEKCSSRRVFKNLSRFFVKYDFKNYKKETRTSLVDLIKKTYGKIKNFRKKLVKK